jgi:MoaA/NifB/PqqE/SkfB family radical SAM enzyme
MTSVFPVTEAATPRFTPEDCPFQTVVADITHRCNMACRNCYIPNRTIPDMETPWLLAMMARLPRGTFIRFIGAEPTLHPDLPLLIGEARRLRLHPVLITNGLRLTSRSYVRELKDAGLQIVSLSFSGGFDDDLYEAIDDLRCADKKLAALDNLRAENVYTALGMIIVRGVNEHELAKVLRYIRANRFVREFHLRSVGAVGRYMTEPSPLNIDELADVFARNAGVPRAMLPRVPTASHYDFPFGDRLRVQLTEWPELGSTKRGRLTPEGMIEPFFEHLIANDGGY